MEQIRLLHPAKGAPCRFRAALDSAVCESRTNLHLVSVSQGTQRHLRRPSAEHTQRRRTRPLPGVLQDGRPRRAAACRHEVLGGHRPLRACVYAIICPHANASMSVSMVPHRVDCSAPASPLTAAWLCGSTT